MSYYDDCPTECAPRRIKANTAAASVMNITTAMPAEISVQREYFLQRLYTAQCTKQNELVKLYNLFVNNTPKTYKDLIAAIEGKKYTLDTKLIAKMEDDEPWMHDVFAGIIWDGPQPDRKGYDLALIEMGKQYNITKDNIMAGEPAAMKDAIAAFELWLPTQNAPTTTTTQ